MDAPPRPRLPDPLTVTGLGQVLGSDGPLDVVPFLKNVKTQKYMGKQDKLAVVAVGRAAKDAGLGPERLATRTGVYLAVGYIPFERTDVEPIARASAEDGKLSMERFSKRAFPAVNPLLTFRCLPNMPIFHVSLNLGIQGPYFITYPGPGQLYLALERARAALASGEVDAALVGGVADQRNFLVEHHFGRLTPAEAAPLVDAAAFVVLERAPGAAGARGRLEALELAYRPPPEGPADPAPASSYEGALGTAPAPAASLGPGELLVRLARGREAGARGPVEHRLRTRDGLTGTSRWSLA